MNYKIGDIVAFVKNSIVGEAIGFFQNLDDWYNKETGLPVDPDIISHIALVINDTEYIEADAKKGVRICKLADLPTDRPFFHCVLKDEKRSKIYKWHFLFNQFVYKQVNKRYDYKGIFHIALKFFGIKPKEDSRYFFCSELAYKAFEEVAIFHDINTSAKTPSDMFAEDIFSQRRLINGATVKQN